MRARAHMTMALIMICVFVALPAGALATPPEPLTVEAHLWLDPENPSLATGAFEAYGLFTDSGLASEVFFIDEDTIHGIKTLEGGAGTITIKFQAQLTWTGPTTGMAQGRYVILAGTGAYEKLHGAGESFAELDLMAYPDPNIWAQYTGSAHFD